MINLAGSPLADAYCAKELTLAGICVDINDKLQDGEVSTHVTGHLLLPHVDIRFERAWYYWIARGLVPLAAAEAMYADDVGKRDVRVAGHCGCPPPKEWACAFRRVNGVMTKIIHDPLGKKREEYERVSRIFNMEPGTENVEFVPSIDGLELYVRNYHIDSQEGLHLFAKTLREYAR